MFYSVIWTVKGNIERPFVAASEKRILNSTYFPFLHFFYLQIKQKEPINSEGDVLIEPCGQVSQTELITC